MMQIKITIILHVIFFLKIPHSGSSFHYPTCFLKLRLKNSKKNIFLLSLNLNFQGNLDLKVEKIKRANFVNS